MSLILSITSADFESVVGKISEPTFYRHPEWSSQALVRELLRADSLDYRERDDIEEDESIKQLIPYVVFRRGNEVFRYYRTQKCGEERLRGNSSIGVGGHIEAIDGEPGMLAYCTAVSRETEEEVGYKFPSQANAIDSIQGLLYDPSEAVGRVHVGIVHVVQLGPRGGLETQEDALSDGRFQHRMYLQKDIHKFEVWSQLLIPVL